MKAAQVKLTDGPIDLDEFARLKALYGPLAESVRELVDATIRTEVDDEVIREVHAEIEAATAKLRARQLDGSFGMRTTVTGETFSWGNASVGLRNAVAPPLVIESDGAGRYWTQVTLGAAYEGPPGLVHGGVCALVLDHLLGVTGSADARRLTGTLTLRYRRGTPLGPLHAEARVASVDGRKATVRGTLSDAEGVTVEAEGIFVAPAASV
ncbi:PaaI family thioesterase [Rhodococcus spelaei]|uniref:PaaI family thioesterase n=1 Tax=Rhodococcus spelaei TaxID=2546320 RepID=A0A541B7G9_9NOCA|nr:PaaI family thioesterase [Rhodococcus spelaei]TQF68233.1 PaaI family thioesterase [Rhodococcus spelaei]